MIRGLIIMYSAMHFVLEIPEDDDMPSYPSSDDLLGSSTALGMKWSEVFTLILIMGLAQMTVWYYISVSIININVNFFLKYVHFCTKVIYS